MLYKVQRAIAQRRLIRRGDHVLVGVSGGADSIALLYALHFLKDEYELQLTVAHLNHLIRGKEAARDMRFVRRVAWRLGVPVVCGRADVPARARRRGISLEMAAREARYAFFQATARKVKAGSLALAHTADDQAETVLLRLARGAGMQGLAGISFRSQQRGLTVIRPMLEVRHQEAVAFLEGHGLAWREDATNRDLQFLRNRVRHEILPLMEVRLNPRVRQALTRAAELLREDHEWLDALAEELRAGCVDPGRPDALRADAVANLSLAARRRVLMRWLLERGVEGACIDFEALRRVEVLLRGETGMRSVPVGGGWRVARRYRRLCVERGGALPATGYRVALAVPGETILPEQGLRVVTEWGTGVVRQRGLRPGHLPGRASLDAEAVGRARLYVRTWRAGDRIRPLGLQGSKKVQDVFVDGKLPRDQRGRVPLLECRREIIWLPGYRVARGWEVKGERDRALQVLVERIGR